MSTCTVCFVFHDEEAPLSSDGGCLCCQSNHEPFCACGVAGNVGPDPYSSDVDNDDEPRILCDECAENRRDDMSMVRVVRVELMYIVKGDNEAAFKNSVQRLKEYTYLCRGECGPEIVCASTEPRVVVEGQ